MGAQKVIRGKGRPLFFPIGKIFCFFAFSDRHFRRFGMRLNETDVSIVCGPLYAFRIGRGYCIPARHKICDRKPEKPGIRGGIRSKQTHPPPAGAPAPRACSSSIFFYFYFLFPNYLYSYPSSSYPLFSPRFFRSGGIKPSFRYDLSSRNRSSKFRALKSFSWGINLF